MRVERLSEFREFLHLREEWNSLLARGSKDCVSMTHEWLCSWWEAFGADADLWVLLLRERGCLLGAAPLMLKRDRFRGLPAKALTFMVNGHTPEGNLMLAEPEADSAASLLNFLHETEGDWDVLRLEKLPRRSALARYLPEWLGDNGFSYLRTDSLCSPYIDMAQDWDVYYSGRSKKFRKVMRNKLNRVERDGTVKIERISDAATIRNALDDVFGVSARSWKAEVGRSIPDDPRVEAFYRKITDALGERGMVDLWLMRRDGEAIAFEYHIRHGRVAFPIRADFDDGYRHLSPGSVLEYEILRRLFSDPEVQGYNSCGATYDYLMNWATELVERVDFLIFNSRAYSRSLYFLESKMIPVARKVRSLLRPAGNEEDD